MHGLVVGRFQPLHNGHRHVMAAALAECDQVTVGIGSSNQPPSLRNPFTVAQREAMVRACFPEDVRHRRLRLVPLPDRDDDALWLRSTLEAVGPVDRFYGNDDRTTGIFARAGIPVRQPGLQRREAWEGSRLRQAMAQADAQWQEHVPAPVAELLAAWDAPTLVRRLAQPAGRQAP